MLKLACSQAACHVISYLRFIVYVPSLSVPVCHKMGVSALSLPLSFGRFVLCAQVREIAMAVNKTYRVVTRRFGEVKGTL